MTHYMKSTALVFALAVSITLVFSCNKDDDSSTPSTPDVTGPVITVAAPTDGDTISMAVDTLTLDFSVYDPQGMDSLLVLATNQSTGDTLRYSNLALNGTILYVYRNFYYVTPFTQTIPANVYIRATDENGNVSTKQVNCLIVP